MKISILHPSRNRPQQAGETFIKWVSNADAKLHKYISGKNFEYILSLDKSDEKVKDYYQYFHCPSHENGMKIIINDNNSAIEAINAAAKVATGDIFIVVSDDTDTFQGWDTALLKELEGKSDFLVKTRDGIQPVLVTMPIMDRVFYNRFGYIYEPGYSHMYADQELTVVGLMLGRTINSNLLFPHLHYTTGSTPMDDINRKNDLTYPQGADHFNERLKNNFGINNPLVKFEEIIWH